MKKLALFILVPFFITGCTAISGLFGDDSNDQPADGAPQEQSSGDAVIPKLPPAENFTLLEDVSGGTGSADAYRLLEPNQFTHKVVARIPDPTGTDFYEGWLVIPGTSTLISTGRMEKRSGVWYLEFISESDYSKYRDVIITLEPDDGDPAPATHILEGTF